MTPEAGHIKIDLLASTSDAELKLIRLTLEEVARQGDRLAEALELLEEHPVVAALLKWDDLMSSERIRWDWDELMGRLQQGGLYQADLMAMTSDTEESDDES